jgi:uncharacterized tellurite resistance protein B-like protein
MAVSLGRLRKNVISSIKREGLKKYRAREIDRKIALGVLLWSMGAVAEADGIFMPEEEEKIREILHSYLKVSEEDFPILLAAVRQAAIEKIDFYKFAREIDKILSSDAKISIIEDLLRIGYADKKLDKTEFEIIKRLSDIFDIGEEELENIEAKIKKESSL